MSDVSERVMTEFIWYMWSFGFIHK